MSSLLFLIVRTMKNYVLEVLRTPSKLILWGLAAVGIGALLWLGTTNISEPGERVDIAWLKGLIFLMLLIFTVLAVVKGLQTGDSIFGMNDVNLVFVSPLNPRLILLYGVMRMATTAFWAGFFILFQGSSLGATFGVDIGGLLLILAGFLLVVLTLQIVTLTIYSVTNGRPARQRVVQILAVLALAPLLVVLGINFLQTGDLFGALEGALRSPVLAWTPLAGWGAQGIVALIEGNLGSGLFFFGLVVAAAAALILYITLSNPDYYEDVLVATETEFEKKRAAAEGQVNTENTAGKRVRVVRTGVGGAGASVLFYKHVRESFRANFLGLWGLVSILTVVGAAVFAYFVRGEEGATLILLQIVMWMQLFLVGNGRGLKELYAHYIYMMPGSSLSKIIWSNLELGFKVLVEAVVIFGVAGLIIGENPLLVLLAILVYTLFTMMLVGINYLSMRWTSTNVNSGILFFLYMAVVAVLLAPGLAAAIIIGVGVGGSTGLLVGLGILALWELLVALGCFALSKGALDNSDIPVLRT